ncbi:hypothetical protein JM658_15655 [Joostella atrarenae]|uniref:Uncharacterized protein n=1 Tax=Joostella atrarenae TaxID=679257 RepID=A0ABS9J754_9FLAO|nr:hypothetical protein [Joostella atrarenae]MCF8716266.1 hypothetical protein [Joostella atrarenae]
MNKVGNKWVINVSGNVVDNNIRPNEDHFESYFENWNAAFLFSQASIQKRFCDNFSLKLTGSINKLKNESDKNADKINYAAADIDVSWYFTHLFIKNPSFFEAYISAGQGLTFISTKGNANTNIGGGFNFWISSRVGINLQTVGKFGLTGSEDNYLQHSAGIMFAL